jgi:hypothetical protein
MSCDILGRPPPLKRERRPAATVAANLENGTWNAQQYQPASPGKQAALVREYLAALRMTRFVDMAPLVAAGVGWPAITSAVPVHATVKVTGPSFEFSDSGRSAYVMPVRTISLLGPEAADPLEAIRDGWIVDLIAFHPAHPDLWALRHGSADWLGAVEPQYADSDAVPVWRSPLGWLQAGCRGVVLLSRERISRYRILSGLGSIVAEDARHAAELQSILAHSWSAPRVIVGAQEGRRAA